MCEAPRLLKNAFGGNGKTVVIAVVSPAARNYEETVGTLRWADRARQIQNKAVTMVTRKTLEQKRADRAAGDSLVYPGWHSGAPMLVLVLDGIGTTNEMRECASIYSPHTCSHTCLFGLHA
jgi:hypothetical protein